MTTVLYCCYWRFYFRIRCCCKPNYCLLLDSSRNNSGESRQLIAKSKSTDGNLPIMLGVRSTAITLSFDRPPSINRSCACRLTR